MGSSVQQVAKWGVEADELGLGNAASRNIYNPGTHKNMTEKLVSLPRYLGK